MATNDKKEIRSIDCKLAIRETQTDEKSEPSRTICGRAIVFNSESEVLDDWGMRFKEVILPEAVTAEWLKTQDVKLNMLHDRQLTLARCNKGEANASLRLTVTEEGVDFEFDAPKCDIGDRCLELVRTGVFSGCSFEFWPQDYEKVEEGDTLLIRHKKFRAIDALTVGMDPAYTATTVNVREMGEALHSDDAADEQHDDKSMDAEMQRRLNHLRALSADEF